MKLIIALLGLLPLSSLSFAANGEENIAVYQELCAKEQDPIKRQNYCFLLENNDHPRASGNLFRVDRAIV